MIESSEEPAQQAVIKKTFSKIDEKKKQRIIEKVEKATKKVEEEKIEEPVETPMQVDEAPTSEINEGAKAKPVVAAAAPEEPEVYCLDSTDDEAEKPAAPQKSHAFAKIMPTAKPKQGVIKANILNTNVPKELKKFVKDQPVKEAAREGGKKLLFNDYRFCPEKDSSYSTGQQCPFYSLVDAL